MKSSRFVVFSLIYILFMAFAFYYLYWFFYYIFGRLLFGILFPQYAGAGPPFFSMGHGFQASLTLAIVRFTTIIQVITAIAMIILAIPYAHLIYKNIRMRMTKGGKEKALLFHLG